MCKGNLSRVSLARSVTRPQATGFALQNRTNTKKDTLLRVFFRVGTPDWIRTSGLQSRSYQAVKLEALRRKGLVEIAQISAILEKNLGSLIGQGFRDFSR